MRTVTLLTTFFAATLLVVACDAPTVQAQVALGVSVDLFAPPPVAIAPPPLPVYVVPPPPAPELLWSPGYWGWADGYYWVPGTWVAAPAPGLLWTPGYWGWAGGAYAFHAGYWGPHVGFYGGINYGGGYGGAGFAGGSWSGGHYRVNNSVTNVTNVTNITNVDSSVSHASFNGGPGGTNAQPTSAEQAAASERHLEPTSAQVAHATTASKNPQLFASANHGKPTIAATAKAADFSHGVVAAREAGARNPEAEQHNIAIKSNPSLAPHGAALPKASSSHVASGPVKARSTASRPSELSAPHAANAQPARTAATVHHANAVPVAGPQPRAAAPAAAQTESRRPSEGETRAPAEERRSE